MTRAVRSLSSLLKCFVMAKNVFAVFPAFFVAMFIVFASFYLNAFATTGVNRAIFKNRYFVTCLRTYVLFLLFSVSNCIPFVQESSDPFVFWKGSTNRRQTLRRRMFSVFFIIFLLYCQKGGWSTIN